MDVAVDDVLRIGQDGLGVIGKHHLHLGAAVPNQVHVIGHIVHTSEGVHGVAEQLPVLLQRQHIPVGVHALLVHEVRVNKMVAYLIGGVAEHKDDLLCALGNAPQADGKAVAAEDGENDTHGLTAQLGADVGGNIIGRGIVALCAGHNGLGHGYNIPVADGKAILRLCGSLQNGLGDDLHQIIAAADNRRPNTPGNSTDHTAHNILHSAACGGKLFVEFCRGRNPQLFYYTR